MRELGLRMDSAELSEWEAFYGIDPFGDQRDDARSAMLASIVARVAGNKGATADKFMLFPERRGRMQSFAEMIDKAKALARWFGGNRNRKSQGTTGPE